MLKYIHCAPILLVLFNPFPLYASSYDSDILNVFSKLMPRFILMSSIKEELHSNINICLVHENKDKLEATTLKNMIQKNYPNGIKEYEITVDKTSLENGLNCKGSQLIFLFDIDQKSLQAFAKSSQTQKILVVSYSEELLQSTSDISLFVGRKIVPYINAENVKQKNIKLENILYRISKIFSKRDK